jgi:hypothetical protein
VQDLLAVVQVQRATLAGAERPAASTMRRNPSLRPATVWKPIAGIRYLAK